MSTTLYVKKLVEEAVLPVKAHVDDTGYDLYSIETVTLSSLQTKRIKTGIAIEFVPHNIDIDITIRGRSGRSSEGLLVHLGTVDKGYRGEIQVSTTNVTPNPYTIHAGEKIAQLVFGQLTEQPYVCRLAELSDSDRGTAGHGSTGR